MAGFLRVWLLCVGVCALMRAPTPNTVPSPPRPPNGSPSSAKTANKGPPRRDPRTDVAPPRRFTPPMASRACCRGVSRPRRTKRFRTRSVLVTDLEADTTSGHRPRFLALLARPKGIQHRWAVSVCGTVGYAERGPDGADDSTRFLLGRQVELGVLRRVFCRIPKPSCGGIRSGHGLNQYLRRYRSRPGVTVDAEGGLRRVRLREGIGQGGPLGWHVGPTLGVGYRIWDRLFLRALGDVLCTTLRFSRRRQC